MLADRAGIPRKWHTAIYGTLIPFGVAITYSPSYWRRWTFWLTIVICLAVHALAFWSLFVYVFTKSMYPGLLVWTPVVFVEAFALLIAAIRVEKNLNGKKARNIVS